MANIILAAGGTGGHIFPALAVAEILSGAGHKVTLFTDRRGEPMVEGKISYQLIHSASPFNKGLFAKIGGITQLAIGFLQSLMRMVILRPDAVIGFGGYPSLAPILAGRLIRAKCILHEQNAVMGRANRLLASLAHQVALSFVPTKSCPQTASITHTGLPVRRAFNDIPAYQPTGENCHLVIIGGSLGAQIFADIIPQAIAQLPAPLQANLRISQQARDEHIASLQSAYQEQTITADVARFFHDVADLYHHADVIISRAGASSVAEIAAAGRASILVPFAGALDDHQTGNAKSLSDHKASITIAEADLTPAHLARELAKLMSDHSTRSQMAQAAKHQSHRDNAYAIASLTGLSLAPQSPQGVAQ